MRSARAYDQANNADSTVAYLERYLVATSDSRINPDTWMLGRRTSGSVSCTKRGANEEGGDALCCVRGAWKKADADLQPKVAEARARLERVRRALPR